MLPWDPIRATNTSITITWSPAWNPLAEIDRYELEARRPAGNALSMADRERLQFSELQNEDLGWPGDQAWTNWTTVYMGRGRAYTLGVPPRTGHAAQFRVRACGPEATFVIGNPSDCSEWSPVQNAHTVLSASADKINIYMRGTGKNAPNYTYISVNNQTIYYRRDETGLVLAIFSRLDFSLHWLKTYDTHRSRDQSVQMSSDIRQFNQSFFVFVASTIAWEWHTSRTLARTLEYCGAFHFGQWAHVFAEQGHYESTISDIQQTASQDEFGHPYAFIGIPGIGTAMGWESLMYNTGNYLGGKTVNVPKAIVAGIAYYDYTARLYRLSDITSTKADFYLKGTSPARETLHNPVPVRKVKPATNMVPPMRDYIPYVGTLQNHITKLIEANGTVPPYNFAFALMTVADVRKKDPRPERYWVTELERVWSGSSARYWPHNGSSLLKGVELDERNCSYYVYHGYLDASPELCGPDGSYCCEAIDVAGFQAAACDVGVAPTVCANVTVMNLTSNVTLLDHWAPYPFRVIDSPYVFEFEQRIYTPIVVPTPAPGPEHRRRTGFR